MKIYGEQHVTGSWEQLRKQP